MSASSRVFYTLWRREFKSLLRSMFGWFLIASFAAVVGGILLFVLWHFDGLIAQPLPAVFSASLAAAFPPLIAFATMRSFAEERQNGTLENLLTAPIPNSAIVWAKFAGAFTVVVLAIAAAVGGLALYAELADASIDYSRTALGNAIATLIPHAASLTALGILVSILARSQGQAAIVSFALFIPPVLFLCGAFSNAELPAWFNRLDIRPAAYGTIDTRPVVFALSTLFLFLFASVRALESRRWKL